ncbi:hypothetical protein CICLE_v10024660mg [Citrus x clementina]|uniref:Uncharacterized protein n=1 Tax=Citrus clementina TaxID=85681 RepID=V4TNH1_CITCL|nr:hypothetical protein CICLE_v10024660mg [Citrus x clementina]
MLGRLKLVEVAAVMMMRNHNLKDLNNSNEGHSLVNIIFSESTCNSVSAHLSFNFIFSADRISFTFFVFVYCISSCCLFPC